MKYCYEGGGGSEDVREKCKKENIYIYKIEER